MTDPQNLTRMELLGYYLAHILAGLALGILVGAFIPPLV